MSKSTDAFDLTHVLCSLAWLGELDCAHSLCRWFPNCSVSAVEKPVGRMPKNKLIDTWPGWMAVA